MEQLLGQPAVENGLQTSYGIVDLSFPCRINREFYCILQLRLLLHLQLQLELELELE